jgi:hypothetical protein
MWSMAKPRLVPPGATRGPLLATAAVLSALVTGTAGAVQDLTHREADSMEQKLAAVEARSGARPARSIGAPVRTAFSEREINAYLRFKGQDLLPKGVVDPQVVIVGDRRVSGRAIVDLDAVRTSKERTWLDPAAYLSGLVEVRATGLLHTADGKGTFQLESATVGTLPIPKSLLQELVSYYSRSSELPGGFELDKPFELPAGIREVEIQRGTATVIQQ